LDHRVDPNAYDDLYRRIETEVRHGDYRSALKLSQEAVTVARQLGDQELTHKAISNLSVIYLELGEPKRAERGLREIILRSSDAAVVCGAAYNLAVSLRRQKNVDRAVFFAQKALERARSMRHSTWLSRCYNLLGNIALCQSDFDEALRHYRRSLQIRRRMDEDTRFSQAILLDNIGYCWLLKQRYGKGIGLVHEALTLAEEVGSKRYVAESCQDLCFGYMKSGNPRRAITYGRRALALAERQGYADIVRNGYYLLGEAYSRAGRESVAERYYGKLQALYPHLPFLREFLNTFDVSDIIALKNP
jgi:tetratricopeptide (TPR) repeat protein